MNIFEITGKDLFQIPVFAEAIKKCDRVLKPRGIDIVHIITEKDSNMFNNIVNSFVGIAAIQVTSIFIILIRILGQKSSMNEAKGDM